MRIVMAGASGFLGTHLARRLAGSGHEVIRLVRRPPTASDQRQWSPERGELDPKVLADADAVINLAGAGVGNHRWTESYKRQIMSSRVDTTATLAAAIVALPRDSRPGVLLNSSAVGYYGDTGNTSVDEDSAPGRSFLAEVCQAWEAAAAPVRETGARLVLMRTGLPLDAHGGLLKPLLLPFRLGAGGRFGTGQQWLPWISLNDWLDAVRFLIDHDEIGGPVNLVGPTPCTNEEFTRVLAGLLHRPTLLPLPKAALRLALGEFGDEALASQRVLPGILTRAGFAYRQPTLDAALRAALGRRLATAA